MSNNTPSGKAPNTEKGKNILIIVLIILVIVSGVKLYMDHQDKNKKSEEIIILSEENNDLNLRLDSMTYQLTLRIDEIETLGGDVDSLKQIRDQLIEERTTDRKRSATEIASLNRKIDGYSTLLREKDSEILALREQNQELYSENKQLKSTQAEIEEEVAQLNIKQQQLTEKVTKAERLRAENIVVAAVNSRGREREDNFRNRQLDKLKISFDLTENDLTPAGTKDIFVQVIAPNNQVIFDIARGSGTFDLEGKEEFFTAKQDILYNNSSQKLTYYYEKGSDYAPGTYKVRIFADGFQIGNREFEVR
ncbi:hypothetical protein KI659_04185 [Litoribacter alkaliphilus]|uniref:Chromosome segregation protein SMC n=1 Tax=Litoribacter ruber TaxID=702568 RepID=A0AAP2CHA6_9BACT|nr:hypothetical protein [Litoribacter alkaliphilus]MBS9523211.1 hypothetical protein [Litoribacter alkaliphilus]